MWIEYRWICILAECSVGTVIKLNYFTHKSIGPRFVCIVESPLQQLTSCLPPWAPTPHSNAVDAEYTGHQTNLEHAWKGVFTARKGTASKSVWPVAPRMGPIRRENASKARLILRWSESQCHLPSRPANLWQHWRNVLPPPKSRAVYAFLWLKWPYQARVLLIISHPLPGKRLGTDSRTLCPQHSLAGCGAHLYYLEQLPEFKVNR